jgi:predicted dehydrogenase
MQSVGIIGLGNIAAFYGTPSAAAPYCHVGGISHSEKVSLAAVADLDEERRARFRDVWGEVFPETRYHDSAAAMLEKEDLDIVAVCNRGPRHYETMLEVLEAEPKAIFLEKPLSCSLEEMDDMFERADGKGIPITVSYSRHWSPHVLRLQELVSQGMIGTVDTVVGYTGKAFLSFAGHVTDLICQFAGYDATAVYARGHRPEATVPSGYEIEPHLDSAVIELESGVRAIHIGRGGAYGNFYVDVFGSAGRVRAGIYTEPHLSDADGTSQDLSALGFPEDDTPFRYAYDQIADYLDGGALPHCTGQDAAIVNEIGFAGIESALTDQRIELPVANRSRRVFANG